MIAHLRNRVRRYVDGLFNFGQNGERVFLPNVQQPLPRQAAQNSSDELDAAVADEDDDDSPVEVPNEGPIVQANNQPHYNASNLH